MIPRSARPWLSILDATQRWNRPRVVQIDTFLRWIVLAMLIGAAIGAFL